MDGQDLVHTITEIATIAAGSAGYTPITRATTCHLFLVAAFAASFSIGFGCWVAITLADR